MNFYKPLLRKRNIKSSKILVIQLASLGDAALLAPYINVLIEKGYEVTFICRKGLEDFWKTILPGIEVFPIDMSLAYSKEMKIIAKNIFKKDFEAVFSTSINSFGSWLANFAKTKKVFGMLENGKYYKGSRLYFHRIHNAVKKEHISERYLNLFKLYFSDFEYSLNNELSKEMSFLRMQESINGDDNQKIPAFAGMTHQNNYKEKNNNNKSSNIVVIHPGAKWKPRCWAKENFLELAKRLSAENFQVKIILGKSEEELYDYFNINKDESSVEIKILSSFEELFNYISSAALFIGNDSGPAHVANLLNVRTIALWGPGDYDRIRPLGENVKIIKKDVPCRPCRQYIEKETCMMGENICLKEISVNEVFKEVINFKHIE